MLCCRRLEVDVARFSPVPGKVDVHIGELYI